MNESTDNKETKNEDEHWPTYTWRPFLGFCLGSYIVSLWLLPLFGKQPILLSSDLVLVIGGILGVASYWRGKAQADPTVNDKALKG